MNKFLAKKNPESKSSYDTSKKHDSEEQRHQKIFKEILQEFRIFERNARMLSEEKKKETELELLRKNLEENKRKSDKKNTESEDSFALRQIHQRKTKDFSQGERQLIELTRQRFSNTGIEAGLGFSSINPYEKTEKIDKEEKANKEPEDFTLVEINEKEVLYEKTVKEFRVTFEKRGDLVRLQECYRVLGSEYLERNDVKESLKYYQAFKMLCDKNKTFILKMLAYKEIGFCYKLVKQYRSAIINFKKLLQLSWYKRHKGWELRAYDYIGIAYYYLGELEKSRYYHRRMWEGIFESDTSSVRILAVNLLKRKIEAKSEGEDRALPQIKDDSSYIINQSDEEENDLPSPRTGSDNENHKLLPFYTPRKQNNKPVPYLSPIQRSGNHKNTMYKSLSHRMRPFMLISHLSPNESPNNYFYVEQMNSFRVRGEHLK